MQLIRINHTPSRDQLAVFAVAWLVFVAAWGFIASAKDAVTLARTFWILAAGVPLLGLIFPSFLRLVYLALSYVTYPIGLLVSYVVLALVYYLGFTLLGLTMRLFLYDPLALRRDTTVTSYWQKRNQDRPPSTYFRQS
ncbi:MAG: hypothetical protein U1F61_13485 [Opitutaceae bacterium]|jgi:hypothetical protein